MKPLPFVMLAWALLAPCAALAQIAVAPAAPQMLDEVRVQIPRVGTFLYDPNSVRVTLADGKFTVFVRHGAALSPAPPPSTFEVLLGQLPMGAYRVDVVLDGPAPSSLGSTAFTVGPRSAIPDHSDLWWSSDESGWGINLIQHRSGTLFATLFIYESAAGGVGPPRWYVVPTGTWSGGSAFTGALYRTTGPQLADSFDPSMVTRTPAGSVTISFASPDAATLVVTSGTRTITKSIRRQPF